MENNGRKSLPDLPYWQTPPTDPPTAIAEFKAAAIERLAAAGRPIDETFAAMEERVARRVEEIVSLRDQGDPVWPVIDFDDIANDTVSAEQRDLVHRRGCVMIRNHFDHDQAKRWDEEILAYVDANNFAEVYQGPGDDFFRSVDSKPEIYPIYWSPAQLEARQHERMAKVQRFLNNQWSVSDDGERGFDVERSAMYPDRIRRRPPGTDSPGLGNHIDSGTIDLWLTHENQQAFSHLFDGTVEDFDPWDARHRSSGPQYPGSTMCSAFRTFQGWTALSDMDHDQGVLHTIPIPEAIGYLLLRPLLADVAPDDLCGVKISQVFPVNERWHALLLEASSGIPDVRAGDSVWWHTDLVHSVAPVRDQAGWGNVMYIPAAPWSPRNERYAPIAAEAFMTGSSPSDFPPEHYERDWTGRATIDDLNDFGRQSLGLA